MSALADRGEPPPSSMRALLLEAQATFAIGVLAQHLNEPQVLLQEASSGHNVRFGVTQLCLTHLVSGY